MKIAGLECLHADAGHRNFDFLRVTTDDGLVGWSEYNESFGGKGVTAAIQHLAPAVIGRDPLLAGSGTYSFPLASASRSTFSTRVL